MTDTHRELVAGTGSTPRVSVCIPVYQGERYVAKAIQSALYQTYADIDVVVLDNASTDGTLAEVCRFSDERLRVVKNDTNLGAAGNFNKALVEARGAYVKILCADDFLYPTCVARQVEVLEADSAGSIALVTCTREVVDS